MRKYSRSNHRCLFGMLLLAFLCQNVFAGKKVKPAPILPQQIARVDPLSLEDRRLFTYYFYEAASAKATQQYDAAFDYLRYCNQLDSTNASVLYELGNYYNLLQKKEVAYDYFKSAVRNDSLNYYYNLALANFCFEAKDYKQAVPAFAKLVKLDPSKVEVYPFLAESYSQDGKIREAIETLNKLEVIVGLNEKISLQKFQLYSQINEKAKAYEEINKYIEKYPNEPKYLILLGDLYMRDNQTKDAWAAYSKARLIDPDNPYLINSLSNYYEVTGQHDKSEKILSDAILNKKIDVDAKLGILSQYVNMLQQGKKELGTVNAYFDSLMTLYPQEPKLNLMYGNLLMLQGKKLNAQFQYQLFTEANPTNPTGWEQLLRTAFPDSIDASIKICKAAISYVPQQPQFYFYLGICQFQKEDYSNALKTYQTGLKYVDQQNAQMLSDFYGQIGDLFNRIGQKDSSYTSYEKALIYNPQNLGVLNNYSYFLSLDKKDLAKAEKMSSATVKAEPTNPTYLDTYGWVLYVQEAFTMAKMYLEKAVNYSGDKPSSDVLEHYGDALYKTDEKEKALQYWKRALENSTEKNPALEQKVKTGKLN
jgi:tetratricopeptide (TPR) repeat protein